MKRKLLIGLALIAIATNLNAQDVITLQSGEQERGKVEEVGTTEIKYHKESNPNGPIYAISKSDVLKIEYNNGYIDEFQKLTQAEKRWFIIPEASLGVFEGFYWGGGINVEFSFNPIFSIGVGSQLYGTVYEGFSANAYLLAHANFKKTEGHWFGEIRSGVDFLYDEFFYEPIIGYEFKTFNNMK